MKSFKELCSENFGREALIYSFIVKKCLKKVKKKDLA